MWVQANGEYIFHVPTEVAEYFGPFEGQDAVEDAYNYLDYIKGKYPQYF